MEHNRRLREEREKKRPVITDTRQEIALWNIWIYYQKDIMRRLAQQKSAMGRAPPPIWTNKDKEVFHGEKMEYGQAERACENGGSGGGHPRRFFLLPRCRPMPPA